MLNLFYYSRVENLIRGEKFIYGARLPEQLPKRQF